MYNEKMLIAKKDDRERLALKMPTHDPLGVHMLGEHTDYIYRNGVLVDTRVGHNLVVSSFLSLVMCLLRNDGSYSGIQYWAIGVGLPEWDEAMPSPTMDETQLTAETYRVPILMGDITYLDNEFQASEDPTNIIQVRHTFNEGDCNGVWREFGIFGGTATAEENSGILINKRHHPVLTKTDEMIVERVMRFTLVLT